MCQLCSSLWVPNHYINKNCNNISRTCPFHRMRDFLFEGSEVKMWHPWHFCRHVSSHRESLSKAIWLNMLDSVMIGTNIYLLGLFFLMKTCLGVTDELDLKETGIEKQARFWLLCNFSIPPTLKQSYHREKTTSIIWIIY